MTERRTLPVEDLSPWPDDTYDGYDGYDGYDDDALWDRREQSVPAPPWYRSPRLLLLLIGLAAAVLVVAAALLVTGRSAGELPATPQLETRTSIPPPQPRAGSTSPNRPTSPAPETSAEPTMAPAPEPGEPAVSAPAAPSRSPQGPRVNVTRTPMSFSPGKVG